MSVSSRYSAILLSLSAGAITKGISIFFFIRLDQIVHSDLYRYGLIFDSKWALPYWWSLRIMISLLAAAVLVSILSAMVLMFYRRKGGRKSLDKVRLLLLADIGMSGSSTILFKRLDTIVHSDLYRFGLEFDLGWAMPYWTYASLALGCIGITIVATVVSVVLVVLRASVIARDVSAKLVSSVFFSAGIVSLVFSIYFSSSILAFIGLGLVFWGALMLYVRSEDYVKEILLVKTTLPMLQNLEYLLTKLDYK
ncbi:hypothetical protein GTO27_09335, partial [Candidatus Bathyarchaeota archaeon]|nr:hypothetical protein [Candidatus Bathyarchaeota archaeon]